jgi:hypothetical protein
LCRFQDGLLGRLTKHACKSANFDESESYLNLKVYILTYENAKLQILSDGK